MDSNFWSFNRERDAHLIKREDIFWRGPFAWNGFETVNSLEKIPDIAGVYLFTFEYRDGYIIYSAGVTSSTKRRLGEHTRAFRKGDYTILDVESAQVGVRKEIWHGWDYAKKHKEEFEKNEAFISKAIEKQLGAYRLFVIEIDDRRKRERIEFSIIQSIYSSKEPWADLVDGGMALKGRYNSEMPIEIQNICPVNLYGLPEILEI